MADPSQNLSPPLLYHFSAVSQFRYAPNTNLPLAMIVDMLLKAPSVAQQHPFAWVMLDAPADSSIFLVWVPPMISSPATDGCVWLEGEIPHQQEEKGYILETYHHKSGFAPGTDALVIRSRRRYRLLPTAKTPPPNFPQPDPNLWIFHYCRADKSAQQPAHNIQLPQQIQNTLVTRKQLGALVQQGTLAPKPFFLHNPQSWPAMSLPGHMQMGGGQMMPPQPQPGRHMTPQGRPAQPYYPPQASPQGPPPKRYKPSPAPGQPIPAPPQHEQLVDPEEDNSRGDILDHLSPREIATVRYTQHHEWMEEVLGSAYNISQIIPIDMGFGLEGQLKSLTDGIFEPPVFSAQRKMAPPPKPQKEISVNEKEFANTDPSPQPLIPDLSDKTAELKSRVEKYISTTDAEISAMTAAHKEKLASLRAGSVFSRSERLLRDDFRKRLESLDAAAAADSSTPTDIHFPTTADLDLKPIISQVEEAAGKPIAPERKLHKWRVHDDDTPQDLNLHLGSSASTTHPSSAPVPPPPLSSAPLPPLSATAEMADAEMEMGDGAAGAVRGDEPEEEGALGDGMDADGDGFFAEALLGQDVDMGGVEGAGGAV